MAKTIDVGGRKVTPPSSLDPASPPDDLRAGSAGTRPNSFGDAASSAQVKTPAPQLRLPAPEVSKPLFGPHDPVYHGDGRYGAPPNTGATNAAAGATQTAAEANNPRQSGSQPASQPRGGAGAVPPTAVGTPTSLAGKAGQFLASDSGGAALAAGAQALAEVPNLRKVFGSDQATNLDKSTQLYEGIARTANVGAGAALGSKVGMGVGALTGPAAPIAVPLLGALGGVAGGYFGNKATDSAIQAGRALVGTDTTSPVDRVVAQPDTSLRTPTQDPLRVQEARNSIVDPGRASVPMPAGPKQLRFGMESPAGTFAEGYTDMGKGIARKGNEYTNIGANGQPTAVSGTDSRTPDQIANGERIRAETAKTVAEAGGLSNLIRNNNNLRAQIMDGGALGGSGVMNSGMRGNMRINDGGGGDSNQRIEAAISAASNGRGIRHMSQSTLRTILANESQRTTTGMNNATSERNTAVNNATSRANNQDTNDTSRANNQDTTAASRYSADAPGRLAQRKTEIDINRRATVLQNATDANGNVDYGKAQELDVRLGGDGKQYADIVTAAQNAAGKTQDLRKGSRDALAAELSVPVLDDKGKPTGKRDEAAEARMTAGIREMFPNVQDADLLKNIGHYKGEYELAQAVNRANRDSGLGWRGDILPSYNSARPGFSGAVPENYFKGFGASDATGWSLGSDKGDVNLRSNELWEQNVNLGNLSEQGRAALYRRMNPKAQESK
jgi:hypothetical protein